VPIPLSLLARMRHRERLGIARAYFVEFNGKPAQSVKTAFREKAESDTSHGNVTPHIFMRTAERLAVIIFAADSKGSSTAVAQPQDEIGAANVEAVLLWKRPLVTATVGNMRRV